MKTAKQLLDHCKKALSEKWQYVYGAKMQRLTLSEIQSLRKRFGLAVWPADDAKAGKICCDCSGLISSCTGIERSSYGYKTTALDRVTIEQLKKNWSKYVAWGIWLNGHIGVVSDTEGYYYAMDGSARNMVHYPISKQPWIYAIKLRDIDYNAKNEKQEIKNETFDLVIDGKIYKFDGYNDNGDTLIKLRDLTKAGFSVGYDKDTKKRTLDTIIKILPVEVDGIIEGVENVNIHGFNYLKAATIATRFGYVVKSDPETKTLSFVRKDDKIKEKGADLDE